MCQAETVVALAVEQSMNNRQVAVLAASMRTGGRTMNSVQDMLEDSKVIEQDLNERDAQAQRQAEVTQHITGLRNVG